ncbi:hypothetical protein LX64_03854 [Chitinophaga skermanii]|uniref:DUF7674 domain-containing protein n=1 Tax=Chitinophaga skermanii TaxID=331697 RepID=A0A327QIV1_9BACT|nr:hypothetical protein [Chitinophaga skermanii]RAJ01637.1 hypothetical protein LX64_03854 [Chitinophaga skermanii]
MLPIPNVATWLHTQLPGFEVSEERALGKTIRDFARYTQKEVLQGHIQEVLKCLAVANFLYEHGSRLMQRTMECVYVYGLSPVMLTPVNGQPLDTMLPASLRAVCTRFVVNGNQ